MCKTAKALQQQAERSAVQNVALLTFGLNKRKLDNLDRSSQQFYINICSVFESSHIIIQDCSKNILVPFFSLIFFQSPYSVRQLDLGVSISLCLSKEGILGSHRLTRSVLGIYSVVVQGFFSQMTAGVEELLDDFMRIELSNPVSVFTSPGD